MIHWLRKILATLTTAPASSRSPQWPRVRAEHLKKEKECQVCGRGDKLEVHHVVPFHADPSLELDPANLLTLCDPGPGGCHLLVGHLADWSSINGNVREDAAVWREKIRSRPRRNDATD